MRRLRQGKALSDAKLFDKREGKMGRGRFSQIHPLRADMRRKMGPAKALDEELKTKLEGTLPELCLKMQRNS